MHAPLAILATREAQRRVSGGLRAVVKPLRRGRHFYCEAENKEEGAGGGGGLVHPGQNYSQKSWSNNPLYPTTYGPGSHGPAQIITMVLTTEDAS